VSALEPGLYRATVRGVADTIVMLTDAQTDDPWVSMLAHRASAVRWRWHEHMHITDARPLIVLDVVSSQVDYLRHALKRWIEWSSLTDEKRTLDGLLSQIEAQTKPARIPEPGLWGVVEASSVTYSGRRNYVRTEPRPHSSDWQGSHGRCPWANLIDPVLIREGVTE